jgi:hypothetical protein
MSDTKLRDLERRWKETGTVDDETAYLLERVRVGDLRRERLELAAYCGHEAASAAIGGRMGVWLRDLSTEILDKPALVRVGVALGRASMSRLVETKPYGRSFHEAALNAAIEWAVCPCRRHQDAARDCVARPPYNPPWEPPLVGDEWLGDIQAAIERRAAGVWRIGLPMLVPAHLAGEDAPARGSLDAAVAAIEDLSDRVAESLREVVPWALGDSDPLAVGIRPTSR